MMPKYVISNLLASSNLNSSIIIEGLVQLVINQCKHIQYTKRIESSSLNKRQLSFLGISDLWFRENLGLVPYWLMHEVIMTIMHHDEASYRWLSCPRIWRDNRLQEASSWCMSVMMSWSWANKEQVPNFL